MRRLTGKRVLVTGGGSGIGAAIARRCIAEGAAVVIADIDLAAADREADLLRSAQPDALALAVAVDIAEAASVTAMMVEVRDRLGAPDVLIQSAGINVFGDPLATQDAAWDRCLEVNLSGAWRCARAVLPDMLAAGGGAIVLIASNHAFQVMRGTFPYPVAKHGLLGLMRSLALEYAGQGIAVNAISPGFIDTPLNDRYFATFDDPAAARAAAAAKQPVGRFGRADEIAAVAAMLASDEARFICGANLVVDGGVSIRMYE